VGAFWILLIVVIYLGIGFGLMSWIKRDSEFRMMEGIDLYAYGSIVLWPVMALLYYYLRPPEALDDLAAKKSHQDFKNFMRQRKKDEGDLMSSLNKKTSPDDPYEIKDSKDEYRDLHIEELINMKEWQEALRTSNDMLRFAREQQEHVRVEVYEQYIKEIKEKRRIESGM